ATCPCIILKSGKVATCSYTRIFDDTVSNVVGRSRPVPALIGNQLDQQPLIGFQIDGSGNLLPFPVPMGGDPDAARVILSFRIKSFPGTSEVQQNQKGTQIVDSPVGEQVSFRIDRKVISHL